jgi:8-oxo-dGTP diphosphatase
MQATHRLIAHGIIKINGKYLVIKRSEIKRGKLNVFPNYWDIPGGTVEAQELPQVAVQRETKEEVNLDVQVNKIVHEDSNLDFEKGIVFTRLVYSCFLKDQTSWSD